MKVAVLIAASNVYWRLVLSFCRPIKAARAFTSRSAMACSFPAVDSWKLLARFLAWGGASLLLSFVIDAESWLRLDPRERFLATDDECDSASWLSNELVSVVGVTKVVDSCCSRLVHSPEDCWDMACWCWCRKDSWNKGFCCKVPGRANDAAFAPDEDVPPSACMIWLMESCW